MHMKILRVRLSRSITYLGIGTLGVVLNYNINILDFKLDKEARHQIYMYYTSSRKY